MSKNVFITGASRGIGYETALAFANKGFDIGFSYVQNDEKADILVEKLHEIGVNSYKYKADASNYKSMEEVIEDYMSKAKKIDVLVCNAGISTYGTITDMSVEEIQRTIETNIYSVIYTCKLVSPYMISQKSGSIVNMSSMWGIVGASCESIYSASKGAIIAFSKSLAKELGPSNIRVNVLAPGVVMTDMMSDFTDEDVNYLKQMSALNAVSYPKDIAKSVVFLSSDEAISYTGQVLSPNCGMVI